MNTAFTARPYLLCLSAAVAAAGVASAADAPASNAARGAAAEAATPRASDGHPDLSGNWVGRTGVTFLVDFPKGEAGSGSINVGIASISRGGGFNTQRAGGSGATRQTSARDNLPAYKSPEMLAKANTLYDNGSREDKVAKCGHPGLPRVGAPTKIVQTPREIVFLYADLAGMVWRVIPTDGRGFRSRADSSLYGDSIGHWDGDTLVVEAQNFVDDTWFGEYGYIHSDQMRVVERLTRKGNTITYQATVEDPTVLSKPWVKAPVTLQYTDEQIEEPLPCVATSYDQGHHEQRAP